MAFERMALGMARLGLDAFRHTALRVGVALPSRQAAAAARELGNKLAAFEAFRCAGPTVGVAADVPLTAAVRRARGLPAFAAPWVVEGLAYGRTQIAPPLRDAAWDEPALEGWMLPLHSGLGMRLAETALRRAGDERELAAELTSLARTIGALARPGYAGACFEPLGFIARTLYPSLVPAIHRQLAAGPPGWTDRFWHGVGRGHYFSLGASMPGWTPATLAHAVREAPDAAARRNAVAGVAWALTLTNLRHPEVVAVQLESLDRRRPDAATVDAVRNGIASAALLWFDCHGHDAVLAAFLEPLSPRWDAWVSAPFRAAFESYRRWRSSGRLEELFVCPPSPVGTPTAGGSHDPH